jgi:hypothetical protein
VGQIDHAQHHVGAEHVGIFESAADTAFVHCGVIGQPEEAEIAEDAGERTGKAAESESLQAKFHPFVCFLRQEHREEDACDDEIERLDLENCRIAVAQMRHQRNEAGDVIDHKEEDQRHHDDVETEAAEQPDADRQQR